MARQGVGVSVRRREDARYLHGRGQYVGDIRLAGMQEVAFVRSPVAHARLRGVHVPERWRDRVWTMDDLDGVKPSISHARRAGPPTTGIPRRPAGPPRIYRQAR